MTKEEAIAKLKKIYDNKDSNAEDDHIEADEVLLHLINDIDVSLAYRKIGKWYS